MRRTEASGHESRAGRADWLTWVAFLLVAVFAGGSPVAVRFSNSGLPPFWGASLRFSAAALIFWVIVLGRRIPLPRGRALIGALLYGLLAIGASYACMYWGMLRAPAGLAGAVLAFTPLMTLFCAWAHGLEVVGWRGLIGALVATAGILLGVVEGFGIAMHLPSVLIMLAGAAFLAEAAVLLKIFPEGHPTATNAVALTTGAPLLMILSRLRGEEWALPTTRNTWAAFGYLVLIGSVGVFTLYLTVLSRWTASATSYLFLLMPVVTVVIAAVVAGEVVTTWFFIGTALVLAGVWLGAIHAPPQEAEPLCPGVPAHAAC
ncbi:MAG: DMT family transporter [Chloroflexota bacterium]